MRHFPLPPTGSRTKPAGKRSVLLLGNYRPTLSVARTLAADGFNVILGLDHDPEGSAQYSRAVHETWPHPRLNASAGRSFGAALNALLARRPDIVVVYPIAEQFVRFCAEHESQLPKQVLLVSPPAATVLRCLDKRDMIETAEAAGLPTLPFAVASTIAELHAAATRLRYPIVVRPLSHLLRLGDKKAIIATDRRALADALPVWPAGQERLLIQQFAPGARHDVYFAARQGKALRFLEVRIVRTDSRDGTGLSVEGRLIAPSKKRCAHVARLIEALGYTGIGCAQFLVDPATRTTCFLELNPRIAGSHRCTDFAGMDLTRLAVRLAAGQLVDDAPFTYRPGAVYAWTYGDLGGLRRAWSRGEIGPREALAWAGSCLATSLRARFHLSFDWRDPLPTLMVFLNKLPGMRRPARKPLAHRSAQRGRDLTIAG